jgi:clostripain
MSNRKFCVRVPVVAIAALAMFPSLMSVCAVGAPQEAAKPAKTAPARAAAAPVPWTILIYGAADNNADGPIFEWLSDVRHAVADDPGLQLVLFVDRAKGFSTSAEPLGEEFTGGRLYVVHEKSAERLAGGEEFPEMKLDAECETDSADPATLRKFLRFGKAHFPAKHTGLIIYSHASGITMCPDVESGRDMGIAELTAATEDEDAVDWTALELCNMGGIEIAYQWRPGNGGFSTDVLVAIPNAGPPLDWDRVFNRVHAPGSAAAKGRSDVVDPAQLSPREFGRIAVEEGEKGRRAMFERRPQARDHLAHEAAAAYDLTAVESVKQAVDAFAVELARGGAASRDALLALRGSIPPAAGTTPVMNYVGEELDRGRPFVDLQDLLKRAGDCDALDAATRATTKPAMAALAKFMIASFGMDGYAGFEPGKNGVFIVFPRCDGSKVAALSAGPRTWSSYAWYSPNPFRDGKTLEGDLSWCRDGATAGDGKVENWFELLDSWYDPENAGDGGKDGWRW